MKQLSKTELAIMNATTVFSKTVKDINNGLGKTENLIKKSTNVKLGKKVTKGIYKGYPIFTLTLEERKTCPRSCKHWNNCYGNNIPFATRYNVNPQFEERLEQELTALNKKYPNGFLVRLHILGDFYSVSYVAKWCKWLSMFKGLTIYGYTANQPNAIDDKERNIAQAIQTIRDNSKGRFSIRFSGNYDQTFTANSYDETQAQAQVKDKKAFICPTQVTKENPTRLAKKDETTIVSDCGACGLCWTSNKTVVFLTH